MEENKIRVNQIKKVEDKERDANDSLNDRKSMKNLRNSQETFNNFLTKQQKVNYLLSKDLIEQYKSFCDELVKQEQLYMQKIEEAKKLSKNRSESEEKSRIPRLKIKDMKNRTKSSSKITKKNGNLGKIITIKVNEI